MRKYSFPLYPVVEQVRRELLMKYGINPDAWTPSAADREQAARFDVKAELERARAARQNKTVP